MFKQHTIVDEPELRERIALALSTYDPNFWVEGCEEEEYSAGDDNAREGHNPNQNYLALRNPRRKKGK